MDITRKSKKLSWLLRHGALEAGLTMDEAGWAPVDEVCRRIGLTSAGLDEVIRLNNKGRLRRRGDRVRCCQGHSLDGMPVTQAALEASWAPFRGTAPIVHGTSVAGAEAILEEGIQPMRRTHVHLARSVDSRVGKRANVGVLLHIDPTALDGVWESENGVVLTRYVPPHAIVRIEGRTRRGKAAEERLGRRLQVSHGHP
jgi:putative RNA 2'-phosphotransferase